jgi:Na+/alanine symporter
MSEKFITIITFLYAMSGIISFMGYMPTIKDLLNKKMSSNILTYFIWTITTAIASLYGLILLEDLMFNIVVNLQLFACLIVLFLSIRVKYFLKD